MRGRTLKTLLCVSFCTALSVPAWAQTRGTGPAAPPTRLPAPGQPVAPPSRGAPPPPSAGPPTGTQTAAPPTQEGGGDAAAVKVERGAGGKKIYKITTEIRIEGKIQKPEAFYVLQKSSINYEWTELKQEFLPKILESVKKAPF
jgi:hypothetical protein